MYLTRVVRTVVLERVGAEEYQSVMKSIPQYEDSLGPLILAR